MLRQLQKEHAQWMRHNFGSPSAWMTVLGAVEELGELAGAYLKKAEGIRITEDYDATMKDAVGDIVIFLAGFCSLMSFDLQEVIMETWDVVKQRDYRADPVDAMCNEDEIQN
jgi:NTP pyrophosphatase (non-canonical NTP hydrolase)